MDENARQAVLADVKRDLADLMTWLEHAEKLDLGTAEATVQERMLAIGARLMDAGLASRDPVKAGPLDDCRAPCAKSHGRRRPSTRR